MTSPAPTRSAHRRQVRGYLLDPRFQLKYTGLLVGVVLTVMVALGLVIYRTANVASDSADLAATQAERALKESDTASRVLRMSAAAMGEDGAELGRTLDLEQAESDRAYKREILEIGQRRAGVEQQRRRLVQLLLGGGAAVLVLLSVLGIFITHRIVGPVFRMKRLCRQVGTTRLDVKVELRRSDELEDLFDTFVQMTYSLKALQVGRLATLDATIAKAEAASVPGEVMDGLRALRAQLCLGLSSAESQEPASRRGEGGT